MGVRRDKYADPASYGSPVNLQRSRSLLERRTAQGASVQGRSATASRPTSSQNVSNVDELACPCRERSHILVG